MDKKDFFISCAGKDRDWGEWIAHQLEDADYSVTLYVWDFATGTSFLTQMERAGQECARTIAVLSQAYLDAKFTRLEWEHALAQDPSGDEGKLIPVKVGEFDAGSFLNLLVHTDLTGLNENEAREELLEGVSRTRRKPAQASIFPGRAGSPKAKSIPFPGALPRIWNVPHRRNRFFTGREDLLKKLRDALTAGDVAAITQRESQPQAIHGLGGIGKTQLALEYAYRYHPVYQVVWWVQSEEPTTLAADFAQLAVKLRLVAQDVTDQQVRIEAAQFWLMQNTGWLLVFDNATGREGLDQFIPQVTGGHVIITSRHTDWTGLADSIPVDVFSEDQALEFLINRTGREDTDRAARLAKELGCLPLALEQAAAYVKERQKSFDEYLRRFETRRADLLKQGRFFTNYPDAVAATWEISFEQAEEAAPGCGDLLKLFAFLAPERIPLSMITEGADKIPEPISSIAKDEMQLEDLAIALERYSLIQLDGDLVSVHRLVQAVTEDRLEEEEKNIWAGAAVSMVSSVFPFEIDEMETWERTAPLVPHALAAASHAEKYGVALKETGELLNAIGLYQRHIAQFAQAEDLFQRALGIDESVYGPEHPAVARDVNNLGYVLRELGDLQGAQAHYERALGIDESVYGPEHPAVARDVNNLGAVLQELGDVKGAQAHYERALGIDESVYGPHHPAVAIDVNNLGYVLRELGDLKGAQAHYERALAIDESAYGPDHPAVATDLWNYGRLLQDIGEVARAREALRRALDIRRRFLGEDHEKTVKVLRALESLEE